MAKNKNAMAEFIQNKSLIIKKPLEEVMHESIMPYAEYVILERALPRVEDGLKPVQRRILYTMHELGVTPEKPHRKSARIVGDALGKYHPHGDTSVYDAMVRMAQNFVMRAPLVDGQGNFGSMDGDSAAAMRYTEVRMTPLATELLKDIGKDTVNFSLNFDDTLKEPDVLPGRFPNLLVNGASGIAIGLATNIPPHNLGEVIDGAVLRMEKPGVSLEELLTIIKGPDFPTGGIIIGQEEIINSYDSGKGRIIVRAKVDIEKAPGGKKLLVITELPYQVNKASLLEKILRLSEENKGVLTGIADIRDESDRNGIRAVIEVKKDGDAEKILNYLYKYSDLQVTFGSNMVAIADGRPQQLGLKEILDYYIKHQRDVVTRRIKYDLDKARAREHILEGLIIAIENIDRVIAIIRESKSPGVARQNLMKAFGLTEVQSQAILDMRLQRLTGLEVISLEKEFKEIKKVIAKLESILGSEKLLINQIKKELIEIKNKYASPRRTQIIKDVSEAEIKTEDLINVEDCIITLTRNQEIKRVPQKSFDRSNKDLEAVDTRAMDYIEFLVDSQTDHRILLLTDQGNSYSLDALEIPELRWRDKGVQLMSLPIGFERTERVIALLSIKDFSEDYFIQFYTRMGLIKKTNLSEYDTRRAKIQACGLNSGDFVVDAELVSEDKEIMVVTMDGMSIRFRGDEVNSVGRAARGVRAIQLKGDDRVIFGSQVEDEGHMIVVTDKGISKRTAMSNYQSQGRGGVGFKTLTFYKNGANGRHLIGVFYTKAPIEIVLQQEDGTVAKLNTNDLPLAPRDGRGSSQVFNPAITGKVELVYKNYTDQE
ncbi:MAG: DNA gyrase subunit A [Clostridiales bacterium]|nr:DNA gyrase subunit A [Clostridiales bacterium]